MMATLGPISIQPPEMTFVAALAMGVSASVHVCATVRLPILGAYVLGAGASRRHALILTAAFTVGLAAGAALVGLTALPAPDGVHRTLQVNKGLFWILGSCLIAVGVLISGLINVQLVPSTCRRAAARLVRTDGLGAVLLGLALGLLQTPSCPTCRAELLAVVERAGAGGLSCYGLILAAGFIAGQSFVVLGLGVLLSLLRPGLLAWLRGRLCSVEQHMQWLTGSMLVVLGLYFVVVG